MAYRRVGCRNWKRLVRPSGDARKERTAGHARYAGSIPASRPNLKTWPEFYEAIVEGRKRFEIRKNDRGYAVGDLLLLQEYDPSREEYTGREVWRRVAYIIQGAWSGGLHVGLPEDVCVMSLSENLSGEF